jgi:hypothetical protein
MFVCIIRIFLYQIHLHLLLPSLIYLSVHPSINSIASSVQRPEIHWTIYIYQYLVEERCMIRRVCDRGRPLWPVRTSSPHSFVFLVNSTPGGSVAPAGCCCLSCSFSTQTPSIFRPRLNKRVSKEEKRRRRRRRRKSSSLLQERSIYLYPFSPSTFPFLSLFSLLPRFLLTTYDDNY